MNFRLGLRYGKNPRATIMGTKCSDEEDGSMRRELVPPTMDKKLLEKLKEKARDVLNKYDTREPYEAELDELYSFLVHTDETKENVFMAIEGNVDLDDYFYAILSASEIEIGDLDQSDLRDILTEILVLIPKREPGFSEKLSFWHSIIKKKVERGSHLLQIFDDMQLKYQREKGMTILNCDKFASDIADESLRLWSELK